MAIFSLGVVQLNIKVTHTANVSDNSKFSFSYKEHCQQARCLYLLHLEIKHIS